VVAYEMTVLVTRAGDVLTPVSGPSSKPLSRHERPTSPEAVKNRWSWSGKHRQEANSSRAGQA
jgi:hypothetical protein